MPISGSPNGVRHLHPKGGRDRPEWVVAIHRTTGRNQSETVVAITRCAQPGCLDCHFGWAGKVGRAVVAIVVDLKRVAV